MRNIIRAVTCEYAIKGSVHSWSLNKNEYCYNNAIYNISDFNDIFDSLRSPQTICINEDTSSGTKIGEDKQDFLHTGRYTNTPKK